MSAKIFADRRAAGQILARQHLQEYLERDELVVLGLPRGGVPVAFEIAAYLSAPLDVLLVRKLGVPGHEELAFGALASGGVLVLNEDVVAHAHLRRSQIDAIAESETRELDRSEQLYRGDRPPLPLHGLTAMVVDDGLATGATMRAAAQALRQRHAATVVAVVPVGARQTCRELAASVDLVVCAYNPEPLVAVGRWYRDFTPTTTAEVRELLARAHS